MAVVGWLAVAGRSPAGGAASGGCAPVPCAAPHGMELHVDQVTVVNHGSGRRLVLTVHFANRTQPQLLEATSDRHTGISDFRLQEAVGAGDRPVFGDGCPHWDDVTLQRGQASGEETVCFDLSGPRRERARLAWSPDLGPLFGSVTVDLGELPS